MIRMGLLQAQVSLCESDDYNGLTARQGGAQLPVLLLVGHVIFADSLLTHALLLQVSIYCMCKCMYV